MRHGDRLVQRLGRNEQSKTDFERVLQERRDIPLFAVIDKYREFEQTLDKLLEHPEVRSRTRHLAGLLTAESSIVTEKDVAVSVDISRASREHQTGVRAFHEKFCEGMRKQASPVHPRNLNDELGIPIDRSRVVTYTDLKVAMLRTVVRDSLDQLFQRPGEPSKDQLLVDKILSLASLDGLKFFEKFTIRGPAIRAVVGAFAELVSSPGFTPPASLSSIQVKFLEGLFCPKVALRHNSEGLVSSAMEEALDAAHTARCAFIRGEYDGKLPHELLGVKLQDTEKVVLSVVQSLSRIRCTVSAKEIDPERIDFSAHAFGEGETTWIARYIPSELVRRIEEFLRNEDLEQVVHRAHNVASNHLSFLLSEAFERRNLPRALWPNRENGGDSGVSSLPSSQKPR
jgi:hypothetical protein